MRKPNETNKLESIQKFSDKKARQLLLKINAIGGAVLLIVFGYMIVNHYQTKLSYLFSSVEESVAQAILRGDQHILDNMSRSIEQADDIDAVWVTENAHNRIVGFYSTDVLKESLDLTRDHIFLDGYWMKTLVSHQVKSQGFGELGTLYLLIKIPAGWLLVLGTLLLGIFLFISLSILSTFRRMADHLSQPIIDLANIVKATGPESSPSLSVRDYQFEEIQSVAESFQNLLTKKEESEQIAKASLRDAVKGRIASVVVHDVRQRLHNAFAAVEALKRKTNADRELTVLHSALTSIDRTIVDIPKVDLSNLPVAVKNGASGLASSHNIMSSTGYPILALIKPVVREYQTTAEVGGRNITIDVDCADCSLKAAVDPVKFQRVISNLLSNSFKAVGNSGAINIEIKSDGKQLNVVVTDNGRGCSKESIAKIGTVGFTEFSSDGSGTGLASCIAAVQPWKGRLTFESEVGKGFLVKIELPVFTGESVFADQIMLSDKNEILVVDDDKEILHKWQLRLGRKIRWFGSAREFQEWSKTTGEWKNLAVLFDLRLGGEIDGISLATQVPKNVEKLIVTSNWSDSETILRCEHEKLKLLSKDMLETVPII